MKRCSIVSLPLRCKKKGCRLASLNCCPRTTQRMFTIKVRLEAGTLHLANYLIRSAVYILSAKVWFFFEMAMASYYSSEGSVEESVEVAAGGDARSESGMTEVACALNIPAGQWHTLRALDPGTVILEMKDGAYEPIGAEDVMDVFKRESLQGK